MSNKPTGAAHILPNDQRHTPLPNIATAVHMKKEVPWIVPQVRGTCPWAYIVNWVHFEGVRDVDADFCTRCSHTRRFFLQLPRPPPKKHGYIAY